jgi:hypothetical protein
MRKNSNCIIFIGGKSGKGKSYATLKIIELVHDSLVELGYRAEEIFAVNYLCWDIKDLVDSVKNERMVNTTPEPFDTEGPKLSKGSVIGIEETGVIANSREWFSATNKALHFLSQTYRRNNYCTIFNAPDLSFIDVGVRKTIHIYLQARRVVPGEYAEFQIMVPYTDTFGNLDFKPFRVYDAETKIVRNLHFIRFGLPKNTAMRREYEHRKKLFNDKLYSELQQTVEDIQTDAEEKKIKMEAKREKIKKKKEEEVATHERESNTNK